MSKKDVLWLGAMALVAFFLFARAGAESGAKEAIKAGAKLVDVRTPEEFEAGHLPNAVNVPVDELTSRLGAIGPKDEPVVVYCRSGSRSARAKQLLLDAGFSRVLDLGSIRNGQ